MSWMWPAPSLPEAPGVEPSDGGTSPAPPPPVVLVGGTGVPEFGSPLAAEPLAEAATAWPLAPGLAPFGVVLDEVFSVSGIRHCLRWEVDSAHPTDGSGTPRRPETRSLHPVRRPLKRLSGGRFCNRRR